ncbi:secreted RxLR effector protein 161-like [Vicia villosa]|uniref:secreted RxLR effector protein 161-like n=1 Tax=Vicia villosa TaxID=3911 RepID=UPI00273C4BE5|nr:secreted RxLR effector protein 161-like [Vicia villosa]
MTDLGGMKYFLGIEVLQLDNGSFICQRKYVKELLTKFRMEESNSVLNPIVPGSKIHKDEEGVKVNITLYKQLVGSMMYVTATRPDVMYAISLISRYMFMPTELHFAAAKRILRYLKGTIEYGLFYRRGGNRELVGFTDSDYAGCVEDRKSTSGYTFILSDATVAWSSKKQPIVTLSTTEAKFVAAATCSCQLIWMKRVLGKISYEGSKKPVIFCDNNSTIKLSKNPIMHGKSKHIDVRFLC